MHSAWKGTGLAGNEKGRYIYIYIYTKDIYYIDAIRKHLGALFMSEDR